MKKWRLKKVGMCGTAILVLSLLNACAPPKGADQASSSKSSGSKEEIKIGFVSQLSGGGALYGKQMENGAKLAVDEINKKGGIFGKKIKLIIQDDQANPSESVKVTQRLVTEDRINAWIGTLKSSDTLTDIGITSKQDIPSFVPVAVANSITESDYTNVYRNVANNSMQAKMFVDYILKKQPHKKLAIIAENTDYGRGLSEDFKRFFEKGGGEIVNVEYYNVGQKEFNDQLTKIKGKKPDGIVISGLVAEGALVLKQAQDLGMKTQWYSFGGFSGAAPIKLAGKAADGMIHTEYFTPIKGDKKIETFVNAYKTKFGDKPDAYYSAATYDAVNLYAEGVKKAKTLDNKKVNDALHSISNYQGVMGSISFQEDGQATTKVWMAQIKDGAQTVIFRPE
ncbi:ABC transporter substrate-binding protein [Fictibacillus sp. FJAT-27399]|uniref:ABC transporter substrate-binding protein n=1 Tax=Fictibacillus sp. FJAT-27399 TaxID=1729689 RepID=UPI000785B0EA|nr:ABC transporter substrate-binding protein [Fictibacillus sp. FJAT-27399]